MRCGAVGKGRHFAECSGSVPLLAARHLVTPFAWPGGSIGTEAIQWRVRRPSHSLQRISVRSATGSYASVVPPPSRRALLPCLLQDSGEELLMGFNRAKAEPCPKHYLMHRFSIAQHYGHFALQDLLAA